MPEKVGFVYMYTYVALLCTNELSGKLKHSLSKFNITVYHKEQNLINYVHFIEKLNT